MYKMHENQQGKRANLSMSIDSMNSSTSKNTHKKALFYQHDDPTKLNYYARFSPNRKKIDEEFKQHILQGSSPLSPKSSISSSKAKRLNFQQERMSQNEKKQHIESKKIELIDQSQLQAIKQKRLDRNEIYIDQDEKSSESHEQQTENIRIARSLFRNTSQIQKDQYEKKMDTQPLFKQSANQSVKKISQLEQSSSFQKQIEPRSSEVNEIVSLAKATIGFQMRIEDDDSQDQPQNQIQQNANPTKSQILILDPSQQQSLQLPQTISSAEIQKKGTSFKRQVKSQNVSFSVDSDLSMIEEKWNSYFQTLNDLSEQNEHSVKQQQIFSENISQIAQKNQIQIYQQINQRKLSDSSDGELPSFSNPNHSNHVGFEENRSELIHQEIQSQERQMNEEEKKQFKRQYTFGNQLNVVFSRNDEKNENKIQTQKSLPLFIKFLSKESISGFSKIKSKNSKMQTNQTKKQVSKIDTVQKSKTVIKPQRINFVKNTPKRNKQTEIKQQKLQIKVEQKNMITQLENHELVSKIIMSNEILIQEDFNQSDDEIFEKIPSFETEIHRPQIQNQITFRDNQTNPIKVASHVQNKVQKTEKKALSSTKFKQNAISKSNWKQSIITMLEKQKQKQNQNSQTQPQHIIKLYHEKQQQIKSSNDHQRQHSQINFQYEQISNQKTIPQKDYKRTKNQQVIGYAKIHNKKGSYKGKAKTQFYQDILKPSFGRYQGSENDDIHSQNYDQSYPKGSERQSLTTATEQLSYNFHSHVYYSPKKRSNGIQEVQNLKKYLKKMEESSKFQQKQQTPHVKFQINQSLEQLETSRSQLPEYDSSEKFKRPVFDQQKQNSIVQQSLKLQLSKFKTSWISQDKIRQTYQSKFDQQPQQPQIFDKSLKMLEGIIPTLPAELIATYDKIYTHIYEQQLKYHNRIEKQKFLLNFMGQLVKGQKEKIDCEGFLSSENIGLQSTKEMKFSTDDEALQILVNKHIILALVRNLAVE